LESDLILDKGVLNFTDQVKNNGLMMVDGEPVLIAAKPLTGPADDSQIIGYLVIGRFIEDLEIQEIAQLVQLPVDFITMQAPSPSSDFEAARSYFLTSSQNTYSLPIAEYTLGGYLLMKDIYEQPALIIRIEQFRSLTKNTDLFLRYLYLSLISSTLVFAIIFFVTIERTILSRVFRLDKEVQAIAANPQQGIQVTVDKKDELSILSQNINIMLDSLILSERERNIAEQKLEGIVDSIDDIILTVDRELKEIKFFGNHPFLKGINKINVAQLSSFLQGWQFPKNWFEFQLEKARIVLGGEHLVYELEATFNDQINYYQISLAPMVLADGVINGIVGVARNITELRYIQLELRQRFDELTVLFKMSHLFLEQKSLIHIEQEICELIVDYLEADNAWIGYYRQNEDSLIPVASANITLEDIVRKGIHKKWINGRASFESKLIKINHSSEKTNRQDKPIHIMIPISWKGGPEIGLFLQLRNNSSLSGQQEKFLQSFGNLAELVLSNSVLFEEVNRGRERMQDLSHQLVKVHEEERRWLARELHDEIGQYLTALKLQLEIDLIPDSNHIQRIQSAQKLTNELIDKVRQMSLNLRPIILDDLGLIPALEWYFQRFQDQAGIVVIFYHQQLRNIRFPSEIELAIFRVIQESLTNVARHAKVKSVDVDIRMDEERIYVDIQDTGVGFAQDSDWMKKSNGIVGMLERANLLGGNLSIHSAVNEGTIINLELPISLEHKDVD
jgi:signal transduction histidine kinase